jgi:hypothetical protein
VYRDNLKQYLSINLGTDGVPLLTLGTTLAGSIRINNVDTGKSWPTGRYVHVVMWYNMTSDEAALDMDDTRILDWTEVEANITSFDEVQLLRKILVTPDSGAIYVDDLAVETYSVSTMAWYRFDETKDSRVEEFTGWVEPAPLLDPPANTWQPPVWDRLVPYAGNLAKNEGSAAGARVSSAPVRWDRDPTEEWTAEFLFYFPRDATNTFNLLSLMAIDSFGGYGAEIHLRWVGGQRGRSALGGSA